MAHPDHITPGDVLRALRQSATLSQRELAERAGMPHSAVGRLEASRHADPRISTFARLVTASGHGLLIADAAGRLIDVHNDRRGRNADGLRDCAGRRLPAHLRLFRVVGEGDP
ncbi:MAG TPA: helix-turn-helix domain-containing protein, partial [Jatrophihabitantaceae bacterium]|nr:helix-turn-helix domain-containing protein [Jatrophihabitantaceae bacterium]